MKKMPITHMMFFFCHKIQLNHNWTQDRKNKTNISRHIHQASVNFLNTRNMTPLQLDVYIVTAMGYNKLKTGIK